MLELPELLVLKVQLALPVLEPPRAEQEVQALQELVVLQEQAL